MEVNEGLHIVSSASLQDIGEDPRVVTQAADGPGVFHAEPLVARVLSPHEVTTWHFPLCETADLRASANPEASPDFCLVQAIDSNRIMTCGRALVLTLWTGLVGTYPGINNYSLAMQRQFVRKDIRVSVTRLIIWPQWSAVEDQKAPRIAIPDSRISRVRQDSQHSSRGRTDAFRYSSIRQDLSGGPSYVQLGIIQERDFAVGVNNLT